MDDEAFVRVLLNDLFEEAGFAVHDSVDASDAEGVLELEDIDLLVTDVRMPGDFDGIALALSARERYRHIKIILMSAYVDEHEVALSHKFDAFVRKPFNPEQLVALANGLVAVS